IVLHDILSQVGTIEDLRDAVDAAVRDGLLPQEDAERDYALLQDAILAHPEWFGPGLSSLNEVSIIGEDGQLHRPDRVVSGPDGTVVVDYKFGAPRQKYRSQVQEYVRLYRKMGYKNVTGCLWYVPENRTEVF
ncbi:MAG: ATP-dependent helicase, partial [Bacteroidales bacterium]|nr:ATP-dependent helicase [Bacteroidales bacterium]